MQLTSAYENMEGMFGGDLRHRRLLEDFGAERRKMAGNDLGAILRRIDKRLKVVQLSDRAASLAAGMSADGIRSMRRQWESYKIVRDGGKLKKGQPQPQKTATLHTLTLLARPLQTTAEWLMNSIGPEDARDARERAMAVRETKAQVKERIRGAAQFAPLSLQVSGEVAAGTWKEIEGEYLPNIDVEVPAHPGYPANQQFAVVVRGNSINRVAQYGDFLIVVDLQKSGLVPRHNDLVIVARTRAGAVETTAKRFSIPNDENAVELRYDSLDPQFNNTVLVKLPLTNGAPVTKDDDTEIAVKGIIVGIWRLP